mmetsp:Transcript_4525/g.7673  ORF Transcript_4525/g.7673 Transcript_4525/m.7673 type:complete len:453 (+) Transcript_4525:180-1538(+)|eukprot:CAMPEP_0119102842 /NCGR_PEP_ID=MMETSP1180-20130426/1453_1 /TAXON_ID=3052 ORGANISM="Chlamydomonas cf sp, Strain CCMP681" /NCGR_SAMPLE_ID=MMETSP1180 /ASSEMBLY_ACC=CAM_ASM_000741 /LENGTH=452 /DNA_ID=CAMNT_0007087207 /DNA_START=115 /DNA_END=1473 /DNA_ORIENTATION=+
MKRPDSPLETLWRFRGVILVLTIPVLLIGTIFLLVPRDTPLHYDQTHTLKELQHEDLRYAIVFDAGSTGSRIHVFKFQLGKAGLQLLSDTFEQLKPGLSSFADDPVKAAASLQPLIDTALKTVPKALQAITPVSLKATAGLRLLSGDKANKILEAVTAALKKLPFKMEEDAVSIMDGKDEGAFAWLTLNYLLGKLGGGPEATTAAIDLGGGSVQEAFALTPESLKAAPPASVIKLKGGGKEYNVYVHSYLGYGLMAARAKLVETHNGTAHPCFLKGSDVSYKYAGKDYAIKASAGAGQFKHCARVSDTMLDLLAACGVAPVDHCGFNGAWRGKRPADASYYVASYMWDRAMDSGVIRDEKALTWKTTPSELKAQAAVVCAKTDTAAVLSAYPRMKPEGAGFLCADLTFVSQLLISGFKLAPSKSITLVKQIEYEGKTYEASWALGAAINDLN